jgi:cobalt/nickel transport system permease protein
LGGITTLGLNTLTMALPAVLVHYLFHRAARRGGETAAMAAGFGAGALAIMLATPLVVPALLVAGDGFEVLAKGFFVLQVLLAGIEGLVTASAVAFLRKVRPTLLDAPLWLPARVEASDG